MLEIQLEKEVAKIQKFLDLNDWDISFRLLENPWFLWEVTYLDYTRFQANLSFDKSILNKEEKEIKMVVMHELCHIFTIANLRQFSEDQDYKNLLWFHLHTWLVREMNIINEQMTVRLERILTKLYEKTSTKETTSQNIIQETDA